MWNSITIFSTNIFGREVREFMPHYIQTFTSLDMRVLNYLPSSAAYHFSDYNKTLIIQIETKRGEITESDLSQICFKHILRNLSYATKIFTSIREQTSSPNNQSSTVTFEDQKVFI